MIEEGSSADEVPLDVSLGAPVEAFLRLIRGRHDLWVTTLPGRGS